MINDDGRDDGLAVQPPRLGPTPEELQAREECLKRVKQPLTEAELERLKAMGKQPDPTPGVPAPVPAGQIAVELQKITAELRAHGFTDDRTPRPHRNRVE